MMLRGAILLATVGLVASCRKGGKDWVVLPEKEALKLTEPCSRPFPRGLSGYWKVGDAEIARAEVRFQEALSQVLRRLPSDERNAVPGVYYAQYAGFFRDGHKVIYVNAVGDGAGWRERAILLCDGGVISFGAVLDLDRDSVDSFQFNGTMGGPIRMVAPSEDAAAPAPAPARQAPSPSALLPSPPAVPLTQAPPVHSVTAHLRLSKGKFGTAADVTACQRLETELEQSIERAEVGEMDGNEIGEGECTLFMYGPDADKLFAAIESRLRASRMAKGGTIVKRYGDPDDPHAREVRIKL